MKHWLVAMRNTLLTLLLTCSTATLATKPLQAGAHPQDLSCEICQMKDQNGDSCKGKVTRGESSSRGVDYTCSKGHTFFVKSKIRVK
jgi:hypothetical protein